MTAFQVQGLLRSALLLGVSRARGSEVGAAVFCQRSMAWPALPWQTCLLAPGATATALICNLQRAVQRVVAFHCIGLYNALLCVLLVCDGVRQPDL
jgi:hypothetical protein